MKFFINIFFILIISFILSVMPVNTKALNEDIPDDNKLSSNEAENVDYNFLYDVHTITDNSKRIYSPTNYEFELATNIKKEHEDLFNSDNIKLELYKNDILLKTYFLSELEHTKEVYYKDEKLNIRYNFSLYKSDLKITDDGFYDLKFIFDEFNDELSTIKIAYLEDINILDTITDIKDRDIAYYAYYNNFDKTKTIPITKITKYNDNVIVKVRDSLYDIPDKKLGLSDEPTIPDSTSLELIEKGHYAVYMNSFEIEKSIKNSNEAALCIDSIKNTMFQFDSIKKLSFFIDYKQDPALFYDIDISKPFEKKDNIKVYLSEINNSKNSYLIPFDIENEDINEQILIAFDTLKTGFIDGKKWLEIIPPEVNLNSYFINSDTITLDFNEEFLYAYEGFDKYKKLMIESIISTFTSSDLINKIKITVNSEDLKDYQGYDFTEFIEDIGYINYIKES